MPLQPRTSTLYIYQGGVLDEIERMERAIEAAEAVEQSAPKARMGDEPPVSIELREKHVALIEDAQKQAQTVVVKALGRKTYRNLLESHEKPGKVTDEDKAPEPVVDEPAFFEEVVPLALVEPEFDDATDRTRFLEDLALADWLRIKHAVYLLNEAVVADPKPLPAFEPMRPSDET